MDDGSQNPHHQHIVVVPIVRRVYIVRGLIFAVCKMMRAPLGSLSTLSISDDGGDLAGRYIFTSRRYRLGTYCGTFPRSFKAVWPKKSHQVMFVESQLQDWNWHMRHPVCANAEVASRNLPRDALAVNQDTVHFSAKNCMFVEIRLNSIYLIVLQRLEEPQIGLWDRYGRRAGCQA
jgi:hypothetical protein